jgi:hypothetical protein
MNRPAKLTPFLLLVTAMILQMLCFDLAASQSREEKQAELDATCEAAREKRLAPMREQLVEECIREKQRDDRAACEQFHSDFGGQSGRRAPLFYDLPECVEAFDYQQSERSN